MDYLYYGVPVIIGGYYGYGYVRNYLSNYIMEKVNQKIESLVKKESEEELFKPFHKDSVVVKFSDKGQMSSVYLPYRSNKSRVMLTRRFFLIKGEEKIELIQKPGIPFLVNASDLGGDKIIEEDLEGEIINVYEKEDVPTL